MCMCGAEDCRACFPGNFRTIGRRPVYVGELTPEEIKKLEDDDSAFDLPDPDDSVYIDRHF